MKRLWLRSWRPTLSLIFFFCFWVNFVLTKLYRKGNKCTDWLAVHMLKPANVIKPGGGIGLLTYQVLVLGWARIWMYQTFDNTTILFWEKNKANTSTFPLINIVRGLKLGPTSTLIWEKPAHGKSSYCKHKLFLSICSTNTDSKNRHLIVTKECITTKRNVEKVTPPKTFSLYNQKKIKLLLMD